jgi:hypothetical protein
LAILYAVASPQSREGNERVEAKIDLILKAVQPGVGEEQIKELDESYARS